METPIEIIEASKSGEYTGFYSSERDNIDYIQRKKELERQGKLETQLNAVVGAIKTYFDRNSERYPTPHIVFQKPLPDRMILKNGMIYDDQDGKITPMRGA